MMTQALENELPGRDLLFDSADICKLQFMHVNLSAVEDGLAKVIQLFEFKAIFVFDIQHFFGEVP